MLNSPPAAILVRDLRKQFRYARPGRGLAGNLRAVLFPTFDSIDAVASLSFAISPGERVAVIGPNGAGKSTTLKMLTGILEPTSGTVLVHGLTPWRDRKALAYRIGVVFGHRSQLWSELPVRDSLTLLQSIYDQNIDVFRPLLQLLVERFALGPLMDQPVNRLSLGQRMRCEIVASLLHGPSTLFLDEPTIGLDITAKATIRDLIKEHAREAGQTVVLTSHDTRDVELVCDRVIIINAGRIVIDQPIAELRRRYLAHKIVAIQSARTHIVLDLPGLTHRPAEPHKTIIEVDTSRVRIEQVIAAAVAQGGIEDITIEDPPMEEVIHAIYAAAR
jgi:ABC-2 type transport system ATP-binding protein